MRNVDVSRKVRFILYTGNNSTYCCATTNCRNNVQNDDIGTNVSQRRCSGSWAVGFVLCAFLCCKQPLRSFSGSRLHCYRDRTSREPRPLAWMPPLRHWECRPRRALDLPPPRLPRRRFTHRALRCRRHDDRALAL